VKRIISVILLILMIGLSLYSCTGGEMSDIPEHLRDYFSSKALMMIPDDTFLTMKVDSINDFYKELKLETINDILTESQLNDIKDNNGFSPFNIEEIESKFGIATDKPFIFAVKEYNVEGPFKPENLLMMIAIPFTDKDKLFAEFLEVDMENYTITDMGGGTIYNNEKSSDVNIIRDGYFIILGPPNVNKESRKAFAETMLTLPEDQALRNSDRYIKHMSNSNPESVFNIYMDVATVDIDLEEMFSGFGGAGNPFTGFGYPNTDQLKEVEYALADGYVSEMRMGMSAYSESIDGSEIYSGDYTMSDLFKNIPGEVTMFAYQNSDMSNVEEESVNNIVDIVNQNMGGVFSDIEQNTGKTIYEILMMFNGEMGISISDFNGPLMWKAMFGFGLAKPDEMKNILPAFAQILSQELDLTVNENNGVYTIDFPGQIQLPYSINIGIARDSLIIASSKTFYNDLTKSDESTSDEINADKIKNSFDSKEVSSIFHINVNHIIDGVMGLVQNNLELSDVLTQLNELVIEMNAVSYMKGSYSTGDFEIVFSQSDFLPKLYEIIINSVYMNKPVF
jgi:hypothetical protein